MIEGNDPVDHASIASHFERELIEATAEIERLTAALEAVAGFGSVNLAGEWEHGLRDIIRSMTDCARTALEQNAAEEK